MANRNNHKESVMFRLKRLWEIDGKMVNLWNEIISGRKKVEYRDATDYWLRRILNTDEKGLYRFIDRQPWRRRYLFEAGGPFNIPKIARFTVGYPKNNRPMIEAEVLAVAFFRATKKLGTIIANFRVIE